MNYLALITSSNLGSFDTRLHIAPLIIGAGIAAAAGLAQTGMNNQANAEAIEKYNEGQMELAKYQNQYNLDMWNRTNEYNSPVAQMGRLADAGLNPHLVYGNGSVANTAGMPAQAAKPDLKAKHYNYELPSIGEYIQLARMQKEIDVADQNIKESQAREANIREQTFGQGLTNKWLDASFDMRLDEVHSKVDNLIADHNYKLMVQSYLPEMQKGELDKLNQSLRNMVQQYANMCVQERYTEAQIAYTYKQAEVADYMIDKIVAQTDLTYDQAEKVYYETMGQIINNDKAWFGMMMEVAKNPVTAGGVMYGVQTGAINPWGDAIKHAQSIAKYGNPDNLRKNSTRRRGGARR